jgi:hypothetical protein
MTGTWIMGALSGKLQFMTVAEKNVPAFLTLLIPTLTLFFEFVTLLTMNDNR